MPYYLWNRRGATTYTDDISIIVSNKQWFPSVEKTIKGYEVEAGAKVSQDKSSSLQLITWKGKSMQSNNVVGRWAESLFKLLGSLILSRFPDREYPNPDLV